MIFTNTSNLDGRAFLLKDPEKISQLPDDSTDIASDNLIKRYQRRLKALSSMCFADFASWFDCRYPERDLDSAKDRANSNQFLSENVDEDNLDDDTMLTNSDLYEAEYTLHCGTVIKKRRTQKIIRNVKFNRSKDPENFFREQLMLFTPWRNETKDIIGSFETYGE